jgi:amidase
MKLTNKFLQIVAIIVIASALICCVKTTVKPSHEIVPVYFKSAAELASSIQRGEITSTELLNLYLDRIRKYNNDINAIVAMDVDSARKRAEEADKALAQGQNWGPLHGLPMTVKDVFEVVGMPTTSGDPKLKEYIPKRNAIAVQRLINAGAIIFGKTNVPYHALDIQTYNGIYGTTNNPWDLSRTPGGSSGGSAAAVAAGLTPFELGSDLGGSIRFPAHYTGIFGHKPTFGIVPRFGHIPPMPGRVPQHVMPKVPLFVVGPLARSADDLEMALKVLTTPGSGDENVHSLELLPPRREKFSKYRVAVWLTDPYDASEIDSELLSILKKTVIKLRNAGLDIDEEARPDISLYEMNFIHLQIVQHLLKGSMPPPDWVIAKQKEIQAQWATFFRKYDILLAPVSMTVAFPHDHEGTLMTRSLKVNGKAKPMFTNMIWTRIAIVSGLPATVAPVGFSDSRLPVGIQIIGAKLEDLSTIAFAKGLSNLIGGFVVPPGYDD